MRTLDNPMSPKHDWYAHRKALTTQSAAKIFWHFAKQVTLLHRGATVHPWCGQNIRKRRGVF